MYHTFINKTRITTRESFKYSKQNINSPKYQIIQITTMSAAYQSYGITVWYKVVKEDSQVSWAVPYVNKVTKYSVVFRLQTYSNNWEITTY